MTREEYRMKLYCDVCVKHEAHTAKLTVEDFDKMFPLPLKPMSIEDLEALLDSPNKSGNNYSIREASNDL